MGDHCSSAVRSFPLIRRPILVPVIQCLVDSLFAALLTRNSCCHAPLKFVFLLNVGTSVIGSVYESALYAFLGSWPYALAHRELPLVTRLRAVTSTSGAMNEVLRWERKKIKFYSTPDSNGHLLPSISGAKIPYFSRKSDLRGESKICGAKVKFCGVKVKLAGRK